MLAVAALALAAAIATEDPSGEPADIRFEYYFGKSVGTFADGRSAGSRESLIQRIVDKRNGTIVERVILRDPRSGEPAEFIAISSIESDGKTFQMQEVHGNFHGNGTLAGPAWRWTSWTSTANLRDGNVVTSQDRLAPDGLHVEKQMKTAGGKLKLTFKEDFPAVDADTFELQLYLWASRKP